MAHNIRTNQDCTLVRLPTTTSFHLAQGGEAYESFLRFIVQPYDSNGVLLRLQITLPFQFQDYGNRQIGGPRRGDVRVTNRTPE